MNSKIKINRRKFFKTALGISAVPAVMLTGSMITRMDQTSGKEIIKININDLNEVNFISNIIIIHNKTTNIFSAKCSHLGCNIKNFSGEHFVCQCHGSKFDLSGKVISGPAAENLRKIPYKQEGDVLIINPGKNV